MLLTDQRRVFSDILPPGLCEEQRNQLWHFFRAGVELGAMQRVTANTADSCRQPTPSLLSPSAVWQSWRRISKVFAGKVDAWMHLVRIAAAGDQGVTHGDLFPTTNCWSQLNKYKAAGLITTTPRPAARTGSATGGRHRLVITITPKGLDLLRMAHPIHDTDSNE